jgi:alkylhydroperoxidase/carboxymuconolactone decarboxylase family protein YurZ
VSEDIFPHATPELAALRRRATAEEIMEAIWVAAEMRAGGAYAHSALALDTIKRGEEQASGLKP